MRKNLFILLLVVIVSTGFYFSFHLEATDYFSHTNQISDFFKPKEKPVSIKLFFVGDIMLSRAVGDRMERENDYLWPFREIQDYLNKADIVFGNLENPISDRGENVGSIYSFRANPRALSEGLQKTNFNALSVANNHIGDWGRIAAEDTIKGLAEFGILPVGGGLNKEDAHTVKRISYGEMEFGFLGYTLLGPEYIWATENKSGITTPTPENMIADIEKAKKDFDVIIVSLHFGEEYETEANESQKDLARKLIDAGAKFVIGHHPHVWQSGEFYGDGYIAYSLGNFVFDQHFSEETQTSAILEIVMQEGDIVSVQETSIRITKDYQVILEN